MNKQQVEYLCGQARKLVPKWQEIDREIKKREPKAVAKARELVRKYDIQADKDGNDLFDKYNKAVHVAINEINRIALFSETDAAANECMKVLEALKKTLSK